MDLGCGSGRNSGYFYEIGYDVIAVDTSSAMYKKTKDLAGATIYTLVAEDLLGFKTREYLVLFMEV